MLRNQAAQPLLRMYVLQQIQTKLMKANCSLQYRSLARVNNQLFQNSRHGIVWLDVHPAVHPPRNLRNEQTALLEAQERALPALRSAQNPQRVPPTRRLRPLQAPRPQVLRPPHRNRGRLRHHRHRAHQARTNFRLQALQRPRHLPQREGRPSNRPLVQPSRREMAQIAHQTDPYLHQREDEDDVPDARGLQQADDRFCYRSRG